MRISDWSSDVCSSDLILRVWHSAPTKGEGEPGEYPRWIATCGEIRLGMWPNGQASASPPCRACSPDRPGSARRRASGCSPPRASLTTCRSEEHTSEIQYLMRIWYAVFSLKKKKYSTLISSA